MRDEPREDCHIIPVRWNGETYVTAHRRMAGIPISPKKGDIWLGLDLQLSELELKSIVLKRYQDRGVRVEFVVYDLIPVLYPQYFPSEAFNVVSAWLEVVCRFDGAICISKNTADNLAAWKENIGIENKNFSIQWFHLGADLEQPDPTIGRPLNANKILTRLASRPTFIAVGTFEPRKAQRLILTAFEELWKQNLDLNLLLVGRQGWGVDLNYFRQHPERGNRFTLCEMTSDEWLETLYNSSDCLIAASFTEGFGLPLVEAARRGLPIIARDIPVFREVAGDHALYFQEDIAECVKLWSTLHVSDRHPNSSAIPILTWQQSADWLFSLLTQNSQYSKRTTNHFGSN